MNDEYPVPLADDALSFSWSAAWAAMGFPAPLGLQADVMAAWAEPHRHYHDQRHLRECMALWTRWRQLCRRPGEVAVALWFHDVVYDPRDQSNELKSAAWASRSLLNAGADSNAAQRVHDLVMATKHDLSETAHDADAALLLDIDLAILGSPVDRFEQYQRDVRREYAWVQGRHYQAARARVLQGFLDRAQLYHSAPAIALLEAQARSNLAASLSRLFQ